MKLTHRSSPAWALAVLAVFAANSWAAATLNITDPSPLYTATDGSLVVTAYVPVLINSSTSPGYTSYYKPAFDAWNASLPEGQKWTITTAASNATFNITEYQAFCAGGYGGVDMTVQYVPGAGDPKAPNTNADPNNGTVLANNAVWTQAIYTDAPLAGHLPGDPTFGMYLDGFYSNDNFDPPLYPFEYVDSHFFDGPTRSPYAFWFGNLFLSTADYSTRSLTVYDGISWGFQIVPEPASLLVLAAGGMGLLVRRRRGTPA